MKRILFALLIIPLISFAQDNTDSKKLSDEKRQLVLEKIKELFIPDVTINFNISAKDLKSSYEDMYEGKKYDEKYLNTLLKHIENDSLNSINLNNIAEYYTKKENYLLANKYYLKALQNINEKEFKNDKALFYSTRATIKINLGDTTAIKDFKKSIEINPNDSISKYFYPLALISRGKYDEVTSLTTKQLDAKVDNPYLPYLYLTTNETFKIFNTVFNNESDSFKKKYRSKNYDEIINYKLLDKYAEKYKGDTTIENCRVLANILGLMYKLVFFELNEKNNVILDYTDYEKNKLKELIKQFNKLKKKKKLNNHTVNKSIACAYFMLGDSDKAIEYFTNAIETFPTNKEDFYFKPQDSYDALIMIHYQNSDTLNYKKAVKSKMLASKKTNNNNNDEFKLAINYFKNNELEKAEESCLKIRATDSNNFNALRLLAHLKFIGNSGGMTEFYGGMAGQNIKSDQDNYNLIMQFAIYQIYNGDFNAANSNIEIAQQIKGKENCDLCDNLLKFIPK